MFPNGYLAALSLRRHLLKNVQREKGKCGSDMGMNFLFCAVESDEVVFFFVLSEKIKFKIIKYS